LSDVAKKLADYEAKRDFKQTPEPGAKVPRQATKAQRLVVREHHARRLHWDFRLERDCVLVSWAVPKGVPADPKTKHLAIHLEDHPLDYIDFAGDIPAGNHGAGHVSIWITALTRLDGTHTGGLCGVRRDRELQSDAVVRDRGGNDPTVRRRDRGQPDSPLAALAT